MTVWLLSTFAANAETSHAVSIYGDIKYPENFQHFDYVNPDAPKGGQITLPEIGTFDNLNPFILKGHVAADTGLLFDTLMRDSDDETSTSYGLVAKSVEFDASNKYIIFNLRPEAKFADGSALTADDVVFSFNTLKEKGHPLYKVQYAEVKDAVKLGTYKIRFDFSNPLTHELKLLVGELPIISKAYYTKNEFNKTTLTPPLGSGPYKVKSVDPGRSIIFQRRDDYWAKDLPVNVGRYNFAVMRHEYYLDSNVAIQAFKSGAVDLRYENIAKNWANAYNIPAVRDGKIIKTLIHHERPQGMQGFVFNLRRDKFKDRLVRKAISDALDYEWMNKNLFYSGYRRNDSYFANSIYAAHGLPTAEELAILEPFKNQLPAEVFTTEYKLPVSDGSGRIRDRLVNCRELLEQAGWHIKNGVLVNGKGEPFRIEFLTQQGSNYDRIFGSYQQNLKTLGIQTAMRSVDASQYKSLLDDFDYDVIINTWPESNSPGTEQMNYWHSTSADVKGSDNYAGIKNPVVDALVKQLVSAKDKMTLIATTRALDRVLLWNYYAVPNWYIGAFRVLYWNKFGLPKVMPKYDAEFGLMEWWVKRDLETGSQKSE